MRGNENNCGILFFNKTGFAGYGFWTKNCLLHKVFTLRRLSESLASIHMSILALLLLLLIISVVLQIVIQWFMLGDLLPGFRRLVSLLSLHILGTSLLRAEPQSSDNEVGSADKSLPGYQIPNCIM